MEITEIVEKVEGTELTQEKIKEIYERGSFTIDGFEFEITKMTHLFRFELLGNIAEADKKFNIGSLEYRNKVLDKFRSKVLYDGKVLTSVNNFFEDNVELLIPFIEVCTLVFTYPLRRKKTIS